MDKQSTKQCPQCGNVHLVKMTSYNKKYCSDCGIYINWSLDENQKPLLVNVISKKPCLNFDND